MKSFSFWKTPQKTENHILMLKVSESILIAAPASDVFEIYMDYTRWPTLFPLTIRAAKLIRAEKNQLIIEVDHRKEGKVTNTLTTIISGRCIRLEEVKPRYRAVFVNQFEPVGHTTQYTVVAEIRFKGLYALLSPFMKPVARKRIRRLVLEPVKLGAEQVQR